MYDNTRPPKSPEDEAAEEVPLVEEDQDKDDGEVVEQPEEQPEP